MSAKAKKSSPADLGFTGYVHLPDAAELTCHTSAQDFAAAMADTSAQGMIAYISPVHSLARLMQDGADPAAALAQQRNGTEPYLALLRKMRRRVSLFQIPTQDAAERFREALHMRLPDLGEIDLPDLPAPAPLKEPFWHGLAVLGISQDAVLQEMVGLLHSHSLGEVEVLHPDEIAHTLYDSWNAREVRSSGQNSLLIDQIGTLTAERDIARGKQTAFDAQLAEQGQLLETRTAAAAQAVTAHHEAMAQKDKQIQDLQGALETKTADDAQAASDDDEMIAQMSRQITQLEDALRVTGTPQNGAAKTDTDKEALREMVRQLEVAQSMSHSRQTKATIAHRDTLRMVSKENETLRAKLDSLYQSTSWRVTGPMRSVSRLVGR
jgi:hypothetical protein